MSWVIWIFDSVSSVRVKRRFDPLLRRIGRETVQYVSNIYKYYVAYRLLLKVHRLKEEAKKFRKN